MMTSYCIREMIHYFKKDARRINHALKVLGFAQAIAQGEAVTDAEKSVIELSAVLHDIGIHEAERKHNSTSGHYQEIEGPPIAEAILVKGGVGASVIERVLYIIAHHHTYSKIDGVDFQIVVEADFLVNAFEDEMTQSQIEAVYSNVFRTHTGRELVRTIYLHS